VTYATFDRTVSAVSFAKKGGRLARLCIGRVPSRPIAFAIVAMVRFLSPAFEQFEVIRMPGHEP